MANTFLLLLFCLACLVASVPLQDACVAHGGFRPEWCGKFRRGLTGVVLVLLSVRAVRILLPSVGQEFPHDAEAAAGVTLLLALGTVLARAAGPEAA